MKKETYMLDPDLKYKTFKKLWDAVPDSGPTPMQLDKIMWSLMKERRITIFLNTEINDFFFLQGFQPRKDIKVIANA